MKRTDYCGALLERDIGRSITVCGWVQAKRDMGGVIFIDLRDREGTLQVVCNAQNLSAEAFSCAEGLHIQAVASFQGELRIRDAETYNPKLKTGTIELLAKKAELLSDAEPLPFSLEDGTAVREDLRLQYRYLDLRRPELFRSLQFRHLVQQTVEAYLNQNGFLSVETPMLTKSTPEGARDYLVPSRVHPGSFYALPQSPQIFKQLLMVGGIDKYYQVARCFRDEDLRADRQPEFTQVDMELSFVDQEDILQLLEALFKDLFQKTMGISFETPFLRLDWQTCMDVYGSDKPDLRFDLPIVDLTSLAASCTFSVFRNAVDGGGTCRAINVKGGAAFTHSEIEALTDKAMKLGAKGMAWIAIKEDGSLSSILTKYFTEAEMNALLSRMDAQPGDFILFAADRLSTVRRVLGGLRLELGSQLGLRKSNDFCFLIVTRFPQFEYSEEEGRFLAMHHPFTMPYEEDLPYLLSDPARVKAQAYDVVLNGVELGSGSIRIHRRDIQEKMFEALGFSKEEAEERFGFLTGAFRFGTPPHGGFAFGLDRLVMLMLGASSLRDVIAFPKAKDGSCPMTDAPTPVDPAQLEALHLAAGMSLEGARAERKKAPAPQINVKAVARLAKLSLSGGEETAMQGDMAELVAFAGQLQALETEGVPPTAHTVALKNVWREDVPAVPFSRDALLQNAPTQQDGYFSVPRAIE